MLDLRSSTLVQSESPLEKRRDCLQHMLGKRIPPVTHFYWDRHCVMGGDECRRELAKLEQFLDAVSKMTLIFDVAGGTESTDKEILNEMEGENHSFAFVGIILHDDHARVVILDFNTIRINSAQHTDTFEGEDT